LHAGEIRPPKVRYYLERRDAQFEEKMREVLMVYQEVALQNAASASEGASSVITVSLDEKPGVQAIENTAPDLPPVPGQHSTWSRDHEYKRHGTLSILAAVDLHNGEIFAQVHPRHRSREYILLLKELDDHYPKDCIIRVILDNHSAHISKETMAPCFPAQPVHLRPHPQARILAQPDRNRVLENGAHLPEGHSCRLARGTRTAYPARGPRDEPRPRRHALEKVRSGLGQLVSV
jgi:DDE superfamily endonuclease